MGSVHNKARLQLGKKRKKSNIIISLVFSKAMNFKIKKTIRYQLKISKHFFNTDAFL